MEIKSLEYKLKYGPLEFLLDVIPPGLAAFLNVKIVQCGFICMKQAHHSFPRFCSSVLAAIGIVFGMVFLYEIIEAAITGSNRKVCLQHCMDGFLFSFGCRSHFFRRSDVIAFNFNSKQKRLMIGVSRCLEKRRGVYSYSRLFKETDKTFTPVSSAEYLSPLVEGGPDLIKFGTPDQDCDFLFNPFAWTALSHIHLIEIDRSFVFSIPCPSGVIASEIVSEIIGSANVKSLFSGL